MVMIHSAGMALCNTFIHLLLLFLSYNLLSADVGPTEFVNDHSGYCHWCINQECKKPHMKCTACKEACYCNKSCQTSAWQYHKNWCNRAKPVSLPEGLKFEDGEKGPGRDAIFDEAFKLYSYVYKATYALHLAGFHKDSFFDQNASNNPTAARLLFVSLKSVLDLPENVAETKVSMPGVGRLAPAELLAIESAFRSKRIYGFDNDEKAMLFTKASNKSASENFKMADGLLAETWEQYRKFGVDVILVLHPLFCEKTDQGKKLNDIGRTFLNHINANFHHQKIIIITKSISEHRAVKEEMERLQFEDIKEIDNKSNAFPCYGYITSLANTGDLKINQHSDIVKELQWLNKLPKEG